MSSKIDWAKDRNRQRTREAKRAAEYDSARSDALRLFQLEQQRAERLLRLHPEHERYAELLEQVARRQPLRSDQVAEVLQIAAKERWSARAGSPRNGR